MTWTFSAVTCDSYQRADGLHSSRDVPLSVLIVVLRDGGRLQNQYRMPSCVQLQRLPRTMMHRTRLAPRLFWVALGSLFVASAVVSFTTVTSGQRRPNKASRSGLFSGKEPYIPSGLSAAEYKAIKDEEKAKLAKMNFGAWGPRFKRSEVPIGDWMVIPSLWTNGVDVRTRPTIRGGIKSVDGVISRLWTFGKQFGPGFFMAYIVMDMSSTAVSLCRASQLTLQRAIGIVAKLTLMNRRPLLEPIIWKMLGVKIIGVSIFTPLANAYLERVNRRKLWSKRRTILVTTSAGTGLLMLLGGILTLASRFRYVCFPSSTSLMPKI
jgi:hypothetical protein